MSSRSSKSNSRSVSQSSSDDDDNHCCKPPSYQETLQGWRVTHVDFYPKCLSSGGILHKPQFEKLSTLVFKANQWLRKNTGLRVKSCETIELTALAIVEGQYLNVQNSPQRPSSSHKHHFKALRLWVTPRQDDDSEEEMQIGYVNVMPACRDPGGVMSKPEFDTLETTIRKFNKLTSKRPLPGRLLCAETVHVKFSQWRSLPDPDATYWREHSYFRTSFLSIIRLFYISGSCAREKIGWKDFDPSPKHKRKRSLRKALFEGDQYEDTESLVGNVRNWLKELGPRVKVTNIETLYRKLRGRKMIAKDVLFSETPLISTYYVQTLRVYWTVPKLNAYDEPMKIMTHRYLRVQTFYPNTEDFTAEVEPVEIQAMKENITSLNEWLKYNSEKFVMTIETLSAHGISDKSVGTKQANSDFHLYGIRIYTSVASEEIIEPPDKNQNQNIASTDPTMARRQAVSSWVHNNKAQSSAFAAAAAATMNFLTVNQVSRDSLGSRSDIAEIPRVADFDDYGERVSLSSSTSTESQDDKIEDKKEVDPCEIPKSEDTNTIIDQMNSSSSIKMQPKYSLSSSSHKSESGEGTPQKSSSNNAPSNKSVSGEDHPDDEYFDDPDSDEHEDHDNMPEVIGSTRVLKGSILNSFAKEKGSNNSLHKILSSKKKFNKKKKTKIKKKKIMHQSLEGINNSQTQGIRRNSKKLEERETQSLEDLSIEKSLEIILRNRTRRAAISVETPHGTPCESTSASTISLTGGNKSSFELRERKSKLKQRHDQNKALMSVTNKLRRISEAQDTILENLRIAHSQGTSLPTQCEEFMDEDKPNSKSSQCSPNEFHHSCCQRKIRTVDACVGTDSVFNAESDSEESDKPHQYDSAIELNSPPFPKIVIPLSENIPETYIIPPSPEQDDDRPKVSALNIKLSKTVILRAPENVT